MKAGTATQAPTNVTLAGRECELYPLTLEDLGYIDQEARSIPLRLCMAAIEAANPPDAVRQCMINTAMRESMRLSVLVDVAAGKRFLPDGEEPDEEKYAEHMAQVDCVNRLLNDPRVVTRMMWCSLRHGWAGLTMEAVATLLTKASQNAAELADMVWKLSGQEEVAAAAGGEEPRP